MELRICSAKKENGVISFSTPIADVDLESHYIFRNTFLEVYSKTAAPFTLAGILRHYSASPSVWKLQRRNGGRWTFVCRGKQVWRPDGVNSLTTEQILHPPTHDVFVAFHYCVVEYLTLATYMEINHQIYAGIGVRR